MLLIYTAQPSPRLNYICKFIFSEVLITEFSITSDAEYFFAFEGPKLNYSVNKFSNSFHLFPHGLLFNKNIEAQELYVSTRNETAVFFSFDGANFPFDIFAAAFYLLTRYEEYLPQQPDFYGRYAHTNALAYKENFLHVPLINIWLLQFKIQLQHRFPGLIFTDQRFGFIPTYDIDIAWSYRHKGFLRNIGGFIKDPSLLRLAVLAGITKDPFDSYDYLHHLHQTYNLQPIYFFLVAKKNAVYDKHILPSNVAMQQLIKSHSKKYLAGLHPSWQSFDRPNLIEEEKKMLEKICDQNVSSSRQHYIKLSLPQTYRNLLAAGFTDDYSMGYASSNGFRASVACPFYWYDLGEEKETRLRIHPFCFMDGNCHYEQHLSVEDAAKELQYYYQACKHVNGTFISIFHNDFLGGEPALKGWKQLYENFISQLRK